GGRDRDARRLRIATRIRPISDADLRRRHGGHHDLSAARAGLCTYAIHLPGRTQGNPAGDRGRGAHGDRGVSAAPLLTVEHLTMRFGGLVAVSDLSFTARAGEITALIGPNGAGKTTLFNCITGFYRPTVGRLRLTHPDGAWFLLERLPGF